MDSQAENDRNKAVAAVHYLHMGDLERSMSVIAEDVIYHGRPDDPATFDTWKRRQARFEAAMSEIKVVIHHQIADGDMVATHWSLTARHTGKLMHYPATGRTIHMKSMCVDRVRDGKVVEHWGVRDLLSVLRQIGAVETFERN